ncbi:MAG: NUDIX hydrolase [Pseudomonadota bacterium]
MANETAPDFDPRHGGKRYPNTRPKPAASIILIKQDGTDVRYLMGQRALSLAFMPGYLVFPGGRLERQDKLGANLHEDCATRIGPLGKRLATCGLRELYEETGLRLPSETKLRYMARAITPPGHIRRYDTRFFAAFVEEGFGETTVKPLDNEFSSVGWYARSEIPTKQLHRITDKVLTATEKRLEVDPKLQIGAIDVPCFRFRYGRAVVESG